MNKLLYTSMLCAFILFLGSTASKAIDFSERYRTLDVHATYAKQTKNFIVKNVIPFHFPNGLPGIPVFKGVKGHFFTTTQAKLDKSGKEITYSETLFSVEYLPNTCPKAGDGILSLDSAYGAGNHIPLVGSIVKQTEGNKTQVFNVNFIKQYGISLRTIQNGCGVVYFDGTDFQGKPYTMGVDLQLKYTFEPISVQLDGEFIIDVDNQKHTRLNAYVVTPVISGQGKGQGVIRPGTIVSVNGNISTSGVYRNTAGNWYVRYITAIYKKNSCQVAFPNHFATKFFWNDKTGTASTPNPTSALWPTSTIIADFTVSGKDRQSIMKQVNGNNNLPIHVESGDCIVQVGMPYGDITTVSGSHLNMESQSNVTYVPD